MSTFDALNNAAQPMLDRGRGEPGDFPQHFASRCIHFPDFLAAVNREVTALLYRRQYNSRIQDSRQAVCRQYGELSSLLGRAAAELGEELTPDLAAGRKLRQRLAAQGDGLRGEAFRDGRGLLRLELTGPACARLSPGEEAAELSALLGVPLRLEEQEAESLSLVQQEPLMAVAGVAARKKDGETVSGDAGTYFKRSDGILYVLLCDGMGSGPQANRESTLALRLLEQFLQAGVDTEHALVTLSSALALRGEEAGGFTTIDLLQVDGGRPHLCAQGGRRPADRWGRPPGGAFRRPADRPRPLPHPSVPRGLRAHGQRRGGRDGGGRLASGAVFQIYR